MQYLIDNTVDITKLSKMWFLEKVKYFVSEGFKMSNRLLGYARVSTVDQNLDRQIKMLRDRGVELKNIFTDKVSGKTYSRDGFKRLCEVAKSGDTIVVEALNRVGRTARELLTIIEDWDKAGITFISLKENIDMSTPTGKLISQLLSSIAEFEASVIRERTLEGLAVARANGRIGGRPRTKQEIIDKAAKLYATHAYSIKEICDMCGISTATLYRYLKERSDNNEK